MAGKILAIPGKWLGVISAGAALVFWLDLTSTLLSSQQAISKDTWFITAEMIVCSLAGIATALAERPFLMAVTFLFAFVPVGLYMLGVPSIYRLIGIADLPFFGASLLVFFKKVKIPKR